MTDETSGVERPVPGSDGEPEFGEPAPLSLGARVAWIVGSVLLIAGAFYLLSHSAFPSINPAQAAPSGHYPGPCSVCHTVSAGVPVRAKK